MLSEQDSYLFIKTATGFSKTCGFSSLSPPASSNQFLSVGTRISSDLIFKGLLTREVSPIGPSPKGYISGSDPWNAWGTTACNWPAPTEAPHHVLILRAPRHPLRKLHRGTDDEHLNGDPAFIREAGNCLETRQGKKALVAALNLCTHIPSH